MLNHPSLHHGTYQGWPDQAWLRDTSRGAPGRTIDAPRYRTTKAMVAHLYRNGILATGLNNPVVPKGDEEIRFQISADHTSADIDAALEALASFDG